MITDNVCLSVHEYCKCSREAVSRFINKHGKSNNSKQRKKILTQLLSILDGFWDKDIKSTFASAK